MECPPACPSEFGVCSFCDKNRGTHDSIEHACGGFSHSLCIAKAPPMNFEQCAFCSGARKPNTINDVNDPLTVDGLDHILTPVDPGAIARLKVRLRLTPKSDAARMLSERHPLPSLVNIMELGMQRMLAQGVTISDFIDNGYTWDDMRRMRDLCGDRGHDRRLKALQALKCDADHFRVYPDALPMQAMGVTPKHLIQYFGLEFVGVSLCARPGVAWTGSDVVAMGLCMQDLFGAGLNTPDRFIALGTTTAEDVAIGATPDDMEFLKDQVRELELEPEMEPEMGPEMGPETAPVMEMEPEMESEQVYVYMRRPKPTSKHGHRMKPRQQRQYTNHN